MFCMNGTTSAPKSILRCVVDKVRLLKHEILKKLVTYMHCYNVTNVGHPVSFLLFRCGCFCTSMIWAAFHRQYRCYYTTIALVKRSIMKGQNRRVSSTLVKHNNKSWKNGAQELSYSIKVLNGPNAGRICIIKYSSDISTSTQLLQCSWSTSWSRPDKGCQERQILIK